MDQKDTIKQFIQQMKSSLNKVRNEQPGNASFYFLLETHLSELETHLIETELQFQTRMKVYETENKNAHSISLTRVRDRNKILDQELAEIHEEWQFNAKEIDRKKEQDVQELNKELTVLANSFQKEKGYTSYTNQFHSEEFNRNIQTMEPKMEKIQKSYRIAAQSALTLRDQKKEETRQQRESVIAIYETQIGQCEQSYSEKKAEIIQHYDLKRKELLDLRTQKTLEISKLTMELNQLISTINADFKQWRAYGEVPFQIEKNNVLELQREADLKHKQQEEQILETFKKHLEEVDQELERYRNQYLTRKQELARQLHSNRYSAQMVINSKKAEMERALRELKQKDKSSSTEYSKKERKILNSFLAFEKNQMKLTERKRRELHHDIQQLEIEYLKQIEAFRLKKLIYEVSKNDETRQLNILTSQREEQFETELALIQKKLDLYHQQDYQEETKKITEIRLESDKKHAMLNHDIQLINQSLFSLEMELKLKLNYLDQEQAIQEDFFQEAYDTEVLSIQKTENYYNISALLKIELQKHLKEFNLLSCKTIQNKWTQQKEFSMRQDEIHERMIKLRYSYRVNTLTNQIDAIISLAEISKQELFQQKTFLERLANIKHIYDTGLLKYDLYKERFTYEKHMLRLCYKRYQDSLQAVIRFEEFFAEQYFSLAKYSCALRESYSNILSLFTQLHQYKINLLFTFHDNEKKLINQRIAFETGLKYNMLFHDIEQEKNKANQKNESALQSILETISKYESTAKMFYSNMIVLEQEAQEIKQQITRFHTKQEPNTDTTLEDLRIRLQEINIKMRQYTAHIQKNERSIEELRRRIPKIQNKIQTITKHYDKQHLQIEHNRSYEARIYYRSIQRLDYYRAKELHLLKKSQQGLILQNLEKKDLESVVLGLKKNNYLTLKHSKQYQHNHFTTLVRNMLEEHDRLRHSYINTYEHGKFETNQQQLRDKKLISKQKKQMKRTILSKQRQAERIHNRQEHLLAQEQEVLRKQYVTYTNKAQAIHQEKRTQLSFNLLSVTENLEVYQNELNEWVYQFKRKQIDRRNTYIKQLDTHQTLLKKELVEHVSLSHDKITNLDKIMKLNLADLIENNKEKLSQCTKKHKQLKAKEQQEIRKFYAYKHKAHTEHLIEERKLKLEKEQEIGLLQHRSKERIRNEIRKFISNYKKRNN